MTALTAAAVLALAASCQSVVAPVTILRIATHESGLDPGVVHRNTDGSLDLGLMQINSGNVAWLGLKDPLDPCESIRAAAALLASYSRYNSGSPTKSLAYAEAVQALRITGIPSPPLPHPEPDPFSKPARTGRDLVFATPTDRNK